jgi:hypothetical protein
MIRPDIMTIGMALMIMLVLTINVGGTNNLFAAKKVFDIKATNINLNSSVEDSTVCGESGDFTVETHISKFRIIVWDNDHLTFQITFGSKTYDSDGKFIANVPVVDRMGVAPVKDEVHSKFSVTAVCIGNSETPGKSQNWYFTYSYRIDAGELTSVSAIAQPL